MITRILNLLLFIFIPLLTLSQASYFKTDSTITGGVVIINLGDLLNSQYCHVKKGEEIIKYTPYEVKEYVFEDGRKYIAFDIPTTSGTKKIFLEQLIDGDKSQYYSQVSLYYLKTEEGKRFFVFKKKHGFFELIGSGKTNKEDNYQSQLKAITADFYYATEVTKRVRFNKNNLTKFVLGYNYRNTDLLNFMRLGVFLGSTLNKLKPSNSLESLQEVNQFDFKYKSAVNFGIFMDYYFTDANLSLHSEFYYSRINHYYYSRINDIDYDFFTYASSLNLPILLNYAFSNLKNRTFVRAGIVNSYNFKNESELYSAAINNNIVEIRDLNSTNYISKLQSGYTIGLGIEFPFNVSNSLTFELRYNKKFGLKKNTFNNSEIQLITGFSF